MMLFTHVACLFCPSAAFRLVPVNQSQWIDVEQYLSLSVCVDVYRCSYLHTTAALLLAFLQSGAGQPVAVD
jgi:hypothetical protein